MKLRNVYQPHKINTFFHPPVGSVDFEYSALTCLYQHLESKLPARAPSLRFERELGKSLP